MNLIEITEAAPWERFQTSQPVATFTQSWAWGEFRRSRGVPVRRFALVDGSGMWLAAAQMEYRRKPVVGGYWFAPRGPVFASHIDRNAIRATFIAFLERLLKVKMSRSLFLRFEPVVELGRPEGVVPMAFRRSPAQNPASTILLDLSRPQETLLAAMHQKTRYNIRVAGKHGVTTRVATSRNDIDAFIALMRTTAERDAFTQHDESYLRATIDALAPSGMARVRVAEFQGAILAANIEIAYGTTVTYLYGASSSDGRNHMAPYALQWDAITAAQRDGFRMYDFWGVNPESKAAFSYKPSWEGITRFKRGWGGRQVDYYGTWDLPFILPVYRAMFMRQFLRG